MKQLGMTCLILILAMGYIGVAYGNWDKTLTATSTVKTGTWSSAEFTIASGSVSGEGSCSVDTYPGPGSWPSFTIEITGAGASNSESAFGPATVSYTVHNYGSVPIKINQVTVSILSSTTMTSLNVSDTNASHPLGSANFNYSNNGSSGGSGGGSFASSYPQAIGSGGEATGAITLSAPGNNQNNGYSVTITFTSKPFTE